MKQLAIIKTLLNKISAFLGCHVTQIGNYLPTFRDNQSARSSRVKHNKNKGPLNMEPTGCHETSVSNYQSTLRNVPDQRISYLHRRESLKSHIFQIIYIDQKYDKRLNIPTDGRTDITKAPPYFNRRLVTQRKHEA